MLDRLGKSSFERDQKWVGPNLLSQSGHRLPIFYLGHIRPYLCVPFLHPVLGSSPDKTSFRFIYCSVRNSRISKMSWQTIYKVENSKSKQSNNFEPVRNVVLSFNTPGKLDSPNRQGIQEKVETKVEKRKVLGADSVPRTYIRRHSKGGKCYGNNEYNLGRVVKGTENKQLG